MDKIDQTAYTATAINQSDEGPEKTSIAGDAVLATGPWPNGLLKRETLSSKVEDLVTRCSESESCTGYEELPSSHAGNIESLLKEIALKDGLDDPEASRGLRCTRSRSWKICRDLQF